MTLTSADGSYLNADKNGEKFQGLIKSGTGDVAVTTDKDGHIDGKMNDGTTMKMDPEGNLMSYKIPLNDQSGRVVEGNDDGSIQVSSTKGEHAGDKLTFRPDGSTGFQGNDGTTATANADGSAQMTTSDGTTMSANSDGTGRLSNPDGSSVTAHQNGSFTVNGADGSAQTISSVEMGS